MTMIMYMYSRRKSFHGHPLLGLKGPNPSSHQPSHAMNHELSNRDQEETGAIHIAPLGQSHHYHSSQKWAEHSEHLDLKFTEHLRLSPSDWRNAIYRD